MKTHLNLEKTNFLTVCAVFVLTILCVADGFGQKQTTDYFGHLKAEHAAAVRIYIGKQKNLRPAQVSDCKNKFGLNSFRRSAGKSAHPYYAAADFNQDKVADFAVVLIDSSSKTDERFTLLIFNGSKSGAYQLASTNAGMNLRQGGIWTDGFGSDDTKTSVTVGVFETDDCLWIEWEGGKYVAHDCAEMEDAADTQ